MVLNYNVVKRIQVLKILKQSNLKVLLNMLIELLLENKKNFKKNQTISKEYCQMLKENLILLK